MPQKDALSQFETKNKIFSNGCRRLKMSFHLSFLCCQHLQIDCVFAAADAVIYPKRFANINHTVFLCKSMSPLTI